MTTMRTAPRVRARRASPAARRVVVGAVGLVLLTATVLAGLHVAPRAAGTAHPGTANPADSRSASAPDDPPGLPPAPRLAFRGGPPRPPGAARRPTAGERRPTAGERRPTAAGRPGRSVRRHPPGHRGPASRGAHRAGGRRPR